MPEILYSSEGVRGQNRRWAGRLRVCREPGVRFRDGLRIRRTPLSARNQWEQVPFFLNHVMLRDRQEPPREIRNVGCLPG